jgi:branched-chain amino acid aminotransferase
LLSNNPAETGIMTLVPFDDRDGWIWWNGSLGPWRDARPHVLSHGLHYASAVFEGERAYGGTIFRLRDHTDRLIQSGRILGFEIPWTADQIDAASRQVLTANGLTDAYIRPIAWLGPEVMGIPPPRGAGVQMAIAA